MAEARARLIRVSSRALGPRMFVRVYVYGSLDEMREASTRFNGNDNSNAAAVTQAYMGGDDEGNRWTLPIVRLASEHLSTEVVCHEMHHAATAIYGAALPDDADLREVLTHYNEEFAHLYSDLTYRLVNQLHEHGYYQRGAD